MKRNNISEERWYLSAIDYLIIDTQVARRGRQYHSNPPPYKNRPTKSNRPTKYKIRKLDKIVKHKLNNQKKRKVACPKCPSSPSYKKQTILQNIKQKLVKIIKNKNQNK